MYHSPPDAMESPGIASTGRSNAGDKNTAASVLARLDRPAAAIDAATPADRERTVDLVRAVAIVAVVLGHWTAAIATYDHNGFGGGNALESVPILQPMTWILQVMPLFFVVSGFGAAASWSGPVDPVRWSVWLHRRIGRIWRPASMFVGVWTALAMVGAASGQGAVVADAGLLAMIQLWFLPVYLLCTAAGPMLVDADRRWGWWPGTVVLVGAGTVDLLGRGLGLPWVGAANLILVWLLFVQLGIRWHAGALGDRHGWRLFAAALVATLAATSVGPYPIAMVGVPGAMDSNVTPPSLALVGLGLAQVGLVLAGRHRLERWLRRPRPWLLVVAVNRRAMTLYLWHLSAAVVAALVLLPLGLPQPDPGSGVWWLLRPVWLLGCTAALAALVAGFGPVEDRPERTPATGPVRVMSTTALLIAGFLRLTLHGPSGVLFGVDPIAALSALGAGFSTRLTAVRRTLPRPVTGPPPEVPPEHRTTP